MASNKRDVELLITAKSDAEKAVNAAAEALRNLGKAQQEAGESAAESQKFLDQLTGSVKDLADEVRGSSGLDQIGETVEGLTEATRNQVSSIEEAREAWKAAQADADELADTISRMEQPSEALKVAFDETRKASEAARTEYVQQIANLQQVAQAQQQSGSSAGQAGQAQQQFAQALGNVPPAAQRAAGSTRTVGQALDELIGKSRRSMSIIQRLRGEILALGVSYIGLRSAIRNVGSVVDAFRQIEAAQVRLQSVFGNDANRIATEMDFLEAQASRLGFSFTDLAEHYTKFSVAAKQANFASESTRKIFISVAESARVLRLDTEKVGGIFFALEQMISKGTIKTEELRRQLGDRLPGAFNIMADAIGVSTKKLNEMLQAGQLRGDEQTLLKFADALTKAFGDQLPDALNTVSTALGRFENEMLFARKRVAEGFIGPFQQAVENLNKSFRSREGRDFFLSLGAAAGRTAEAVQFLASQGELLVRVLGAIALLKLSRFFVVLGQSIRNDVAALKLFEVGTKTAQVAMVGLTGAVTRVRVSLASLSGGMVSLRASLSSLGSGFTFAAIRARAFTLALTTLRGVAGLAAVAMRGVVGAFGGLGGLVIGAGIFVITELIGRWMTQVDDTTRSMDVLDQMIGDVRRSVDELGDAWRDGLEFTTITEATETLEKLKKGYQDARNELKQKIDDAGARAAAEGWTHLHEQIEEAFRKLDEGETKVNDFLKTLDKIAQSKAPEGAKRTANEFISASRSFGQFERSIGQATNLVGALDSTSAGSAESLRKLTGATDDATGATDRLAAARARLEALEKNPEPDRFREREQWVKWVDDQIEAERELGSVGASSREDVAKATEKARRETQALVNLLEKGISRDDITWGMLRDEMERIVDSGEKLSVKFPGHLRSIADAAQPVTESFEQIRAKVEEVGGQIEEVGQGWFTIGTAVGQAVEPLMQPMSAAVEAASNFSTDFARAIQTIEQSQGKIEPFGEEFNRVRETFNGFGEEMGDVEQAVVSFSTEFHNVATEMGDMFQEAGTTITNSSVEIQTVLQKLIRETDGNFAAVAKGVAAHFGTTEDAVAGMLDRLRAKLSALKAEIAAANKAAGGEGAAVPGFSAGGLVFGGGTSTSDSIPARLSRGELVVPADAVRKLVSNFGRSIIRNLIEGKLPIHRMAEGGVVSPVSVDTNASSDMRNFGSIDIRIDGRGGRVFGPSDVLQALGEAAKKADLASAGPAPGFVK